MLALIILNYNTWKETVDCVKSFLKNYTDPCMIYVVDNKSKIAIDSETLSYFNSIPFLKLIYAPGNNGYSAGNNIGINEALKDGCSYFLISNSDIIYSDDSIVKMEVFLQENKNVGVVGPQIYDANDVFQPFLMGCKLTAIGKIKNMLLKTKFRFMFRRFEKKFIIKEELSAPQKVFGVSGCCFMVSRPCIEYIYPLDENTFLYEEEYILGCILEHSPYSVFVLPNTHINHLQGVSTNGLSEFSYRCLMESEQYYLKKYAKSIFFRHIILLIRKYKLKKKVK